MVNKITRTDEGDSSSKKGGLSSTLTPLRGAVIPAGGIQAGKQPTPGYTPPPPGSPTGIQPAPGSNAQGATRTTGSSSSAKPANKGVVAAQRAATEAEQRAEAVRQAKERKFEQDIAHAQNITVDQLHELEAALWNKSLRPVFPYEAELWLLANSSPLAHSVYLALTHEGKSDFWDDERWLKNFAEYGWDEEQDEIAKQVLEKWKYIHTDDFTSDEWTRLSSFFQDTDTQDPLEAVYVLYGEHLSAEIDRLLTTRNATNARQVDSAVNELLERQNALANSEIMPGNYVQIAEIMEAVFGYQIEFSGEFTEEERTAQIRNLAEANLAIVHYFDSLSSETGLSGLEIFNNYFSKSPYSVSPANIVTVYLGADDARSDQLDEVRGAGGPSFGWVPLPNSFTEASNRDLRPELLGGIYLGSSVDVPTIAHEFTHQLDRYFLLSLSDENSPASLRNYLSTLPTAYNTLGLPMDRPAGPLLIGRVSDENDSQEIFANMGMTLYLHGLGYREQEFNQIIGWNFEGSPNAVLVAEAMDQYFINLFTTAQSEVPQS